MELTEYIINNRYNYGFINNPQNDIYVKILDRMRIKPASPVFSIVMPIYNQENIIVKNLNSVLEFTGGRDYEIILIIDACSDNTEETVIKWSKSLDIQKYTFLVKLTILKTEAPLFETAADNLGFFCSHGKYILEIQADMEMTEKDYNMKLLKPFLQDNRIIGMSGRCCHSFDCLNHVGKMGRRIEQRLDELSNIDPYSYYIADTCNRGPLLLDRDKLSELGFLDEANYFLDNSDHDLFVRAKVKNWLCGYVPIEFISDLKNGSTRKIRDEKNEYYYQLNKKTKTGLNGFLYKTNLQSRPITKHPLIY